jgi:hypothetical protein
MYLCQECRAEVDPLHPEVVYAVPLRTVSTFLGTAYREGPGVYFHQDCLPLAREEFRVKPKPGTPATLPRAS